MTAGPFDAGTPLSVVIVSFNGPRLLRGCLASVTSQSPPQDAQLIVVTNWVDEQGRSALAHEFPAVQWVTEVPGTTVPVLRRRGMRASHGLVVALLEDDCMVSADWCHAVLAAHRTADVAIGGAVEAGPYRHARDWAIYFCEYGRFMPPLTPRATTDLPCNNVSYKRQVLDELPREPEGFFDVPAHQRWAAAGQGLRSDPTLVVRQMNAWPWRYLTVVPFHHGRAFGGTRFPVSASGLRKSATILALFLPLLAVARIIRIAVGRRRHIGRLVQALPWIVVFTSSWALGESVGYLSGPGNSPTRWY